MIKKMWCNKEDLSCLDNYQLLESIRLNPNDLRLKKEYDNRLESQAKLFFTIKAYTFLISVFLFFLTLLFQEKINDYYKWLDNILILFFLTLMMINIESYFNYLSPLKKENE